MKNQSILTHFATLVTVRFLFLVGVVSVSHSSSSNLVRKEIGSNSDCLISRRLGRIAAPFDNLESWKIPAVVPLNDEQRTYVSEVMIALIAVVGEESSLATEEERVLGCGQFFWPKNPDEPIKVSKSYFGEHFRMSEIAARLERTSESSSWAKAGLTVHPRNFPRGVYEMKLSRETFKNFDLKEVRQEDRYDKRIKKPIIFIFEHKKIKNFRMKIEARDDVASVGDSWPSSFHLIEMTRAL
jgi:hypothetical protein